jgi:hypothetical protein
LESTGDSYLRVVLVVVAILLLVQVLGLLLSMVLGLLTVKEVQALGLSQLVDLAACEASKELLGERMADLLA